MYKCVRFVFRFTLVYLFLATIRCKYNSEVFFRCLFSCTCVDVEGSMLCSVPFVSLRICRVYYI